MTWLTLMLVVTGADPSSAVEAPPAPPAEAPPIAEDDEPLVRLSLPTIEDERAWRQPGFRLQLGYLRGWLMSPDEVPTGVTNGVVIRTGARLSDRWSLLASFRYQVLSVDGTGFRYAGAVEPTLHLVKGLNLSVGLGLGGLIVTRVGEVRAEVGTHSFSFTGNDNQLRACDGAGFLAMTRLEYLWVLGPILSTGPSATAEVQTTGCVEKLDGTDADTGRPHRFEQTWRHVGVTLAWTVAWR